MIARRQQPKDPVDSQGRSVTRAGAQVKAALSTVGLGAALLLSGCSSGDVAARPAGAAPSSPGAAASTGSGAAQPASPPPAAVAPVERSAVTATRQVADERGNALQVDVRGLHRDGKLLRLDFSVTNISATRLFAPDVLPPLNPADIVLIDTTGLKKYLIVQDSQNQPVYQPPNVYLPPQAVFDGAAYFAAPPSTVTRLRLNLAGLGSFDTPVL